MGGGKAGWAGALGWKRAGAGKQPGIDVRRLHLLLIRSPASLSLTKLSATEFQTSAVFRALALAAAVTPPPQTFSLSLDPFYPRPLNSTLVFAASSVSLALAHSISFSFPMAFFRAPRGFFFWRPFAFSVARAG